MTTKSSPCHVSSESPLWRLFLDSSCSSASVFFRLHLATAQSYFHSPTPWNPSSSSALSLRVSHLLDSFRPGASSYCPFQTKQMQVDPNNNRPSEPHPLLRPSEHSAAAGARREEQSLAVEIPPALAIPSSPPASPNDSPVVSPEEELRRRLYLPLGRPRPFYRLPDVTEPVQEEEGSNAGTEKQGPPRTVRSLQEEVRAQLVRHYGLVRLARILRSGEGGVALPAVLRNYIFTFPCSDFQEEGCHSLRSSASYNIRCCLDNRPYLATFATSEVDKSASNLWEDQRAWLTALNTHRVRGVLALAVDPLTENIFYILDIDRGCTLSSLVSSLTPSCTTVSLGLGQVAREEAAALVREGVREALEECRKEGVVYPGVRGDRVWLHKGQVMLENGLLVKGSSPEEGGLEGLTAGLASTEEMRSQEEGLTAGLASTEEIKPL